MADSVEENLYDIPTEDQQKKLEKGPEQEKRKSLTESSDTLTSLKESLDTLEELVQNVYDVVPEDKQRKPEEKKQQESSKGSSTSLQDTMDDEAANFYDTVPDAKQRKLKKGPITKPPPPSTASLKEALNAAEELLYETMTSPKNMLKEERESLCSTVTMENTLYSVSANPADETATFYETTRHISRKFNVTADEKQHSQEADSDRTERQIEKSPGPAGPSKCVLLGIVFGIIAVAILSTTFFAVAFTEIAKLKSRPTATTSNGLLGITCTSCEEAILNITTQVSLLQDKIASLDTVSSNLTEVGSIQLLFQEQIERLVSDLGDRGQFQNFPWSSCADIPTTHPPGYYWVRNDIGSGVRMFCDPDLTCGNITGGWRRVGYLDMTDNSSHCPVALLQRNNSNIRSCGILNSTCSSLFFPAANLTSYSHVCGRISAYQFGTTNAFRNYYQQADGRDINTAYVDGVSLTHGRSPRHHIWTFAAALDNSYNEANSDARHYCPCQTGRDPPLYVGNDYFCDSGSEEFVNTPQHQFYGADPLWDGAGCSGNNTCCSFNTPPWFYKQLPQPTTDDIEMRVCRDEEPSNEDVAIVEIEIYVQ